MQQVFFIIFFFLRLPFSNTRRTTFAANELDNMAPKTGTEERRQTVCASSHIPVHGNHNKHHPNNHHSNGHHPHNNGQQHLSNGHQRGPAHHSNGAERVQSTSSLKRLGLPNVQEATTRPSQHPLPGYMRPTTAFRNRNHPAK